ncbi:MAG: HNH endonuclease domain-containing protein [Candidatus Stygibacter australis]|nr:HNH endonuclease domain-containing protein [Candidatus Stygibacter australis]
MLSIKENYQTIDWDRIKYEHYKYCKDYRDKILKGNNTLERILKLNAAKELNANKIKAYYFEIKKILADEKFFSDLISSKPKAFFMENDEKSNLKLMSIVSSYSYDSENAREFNEIKIIIDYIISYKSFIVRKDIAYKFSKSLNIKVCPYCNRQYTTTLSGITRPEFDHFFPKSKYPILQLSFFNLIPSCHNCNHKKSDKGTPNKNSKLLADYLHPYIDGFGKDGTFSYDIQSSGILDFIPSEDSINIKLNINEKSEKSQCIKKNNELFAIEEIYNNAHKDIVAELIAKKKMCPDSYVNSIINIFTDHENSDDGKIKIKPTKEEIYRLAFCNYYHDKELGNRPLSKLTKDIALELGLIEEEEV